MTPKRSEGYTLIEVMMALTILAIGASGLFALQSTAVLGNAEAHNLTAATNIARAWTELIKTDAQVWTTATPWPGDLAGTTYLSRAQGVWFTPNPPPGSGAGNAPLPMTRDGRFDPQGEFCAQAMFVRPVARLQAIDGLLLTVRVWWFKADFHNRSVDPFRACGQGFEAAMSGNTTQANWVYLTTLVTPGGQT